MNECLLLLLIKMSELRDLVSELYHARRLNFPRRRVIVKGYDDSAQIDLIQMSNIAKYNNGYNFICLLVNVWSKRIYVEPVMNKSAPLVLEAYKKIFKRCDVKFHNILCDAGVEFKNKLFINFITKVYGAKLFFSYSSTKASVAEVHNKIYKRCLYFKLAINATYNWLDHWKEAETECNNRIHSGYKKRVSSINARNAKSIAWYYHQQGADGTAKPIMAKHVKFPIGSIVRFMNTLHEPFHKAYLTNYTLRQYEVVAVSQKLPVLYTLQDRFTKKLVKRRFYELELIAVRRPDVLLLNKILKTDPKHKRHQVTFLGYDDMPPEWIAYGDVFKTEAEEKKAQQQQQQQQVVNKREEKMQKIKKSDRATTIHQPTKIHHTRSKQKKNGNNYN